jgi:UDP-3-O-[3-hydroxymyristoyl] N-acetylglucosamine deacetylase
MLQQTLAGDVIQSGIGLHSGAQVQVRIRPAPIDSGLIFVRVDRPDSPEIPARFSAVGDTTLSTELVEGEAKVRTVEHLLAALAGLGICNARIEIDGPEVPLLDGSALEWVRSIQAAGTVDQDAPQAMLTIESPLWVRDGDMFVVAMPHPSFKLSYGIDFDHPAIGQQWFSLDWSPETFAQEIAPARTFGFAHQVEHLRQLGLIKGGSLDNALLCGPDGWINPPLRFANEPVRHKLLDLIGDLSLLGAIPQAHILAYKASHRLHTQFAAALAQLAVEPSLGRSTSLLAAPAIRTS